tara:strand:+ start:476 stop:1246 length:771 start_codon:yes stop_codon:yes gene_type:complete
MKNITTLTKQVIALTLIFASFLSCENDDDLTDNNLPRLIRITQGTPNGLGSLADVVFEYHENGYLKTASQGNHPVSYIYNSNNQVIKYIEDYIVDIENIDEIFPSHATTFNYQDNVLVSSYRDHEPNQLTHYFYNENEQLAYIETPSGHAFTNNYDAFGNIIEMLNNNSEVSAYYEFDDKINPYQFMLPESFSKIQYGVLGELITNRNNILYYEKSVNGNLSQHEQIYEYNSNNLPSSRIPIVNGYSYTVREYIYE